MRRLAVALGALLWPLPAHALEASFHSYGGFEETVDAFRLVSMIFADPRYETLVLIVAVVGIGLGALIASVRGSGMGLLAFGFQILVGIGLFTGLVATTGTVYVYDRVRNAYQPVGDVPNLLVLVAGVTNMLERALVETIDDATLDPGAKMEFGAGGHSFDLFLNAVAPNGPMTDIFLDTTIKDYVRQCYPVARVSSVYGVDDDRLFRTTTDLPAAFQAMAGPSTFSVVYTDLDKGGTAVSCDEAWAHISARLSDPTLFDAYAKRICERTGYDVGQAAQLARCRGRLGELGEIMLARPLGLQELLTHVLLGRTVGDVLFEDSPAAAARVMANRAIVTQGLATMSVANEWMPTIRSVVFGIMLFMIPVALLFILTPINLRVASFAIGLFVFVSLWGVIDAGLFQLTQARAMDVLGGLRSTGLAADTWAMAPSAAMKALSIFGTFRTAAAGLAGAFTFTVFRFSGNVFNSLTSGALTPLSQASAAGAATGTSEGHASALEAQASALGTRSRAAAASSFSGFGERESFAATRSFGEADRIVGEGSGPAGTNALAIGQTEGARTMGSLAPALASRNLGDPGVARAVEANAATGAIHQFAEKDVLRGLGTGYFGAGRQGEQAFAAFSQAYVQWKAFGDTRAFQGMMTAATRHFERSGYSRSDAELKASGVIAEASSDPTLAKLTANAFDQRQMLLNDLTQAQTQVGAMEGRRDYAGGHIAATERLNVATEQAKRSGHNEGQRNASAMLGLGVDETARRIGFIQALTGEARSSAISQLARSTGRNEAQVMKALETYGAATQLGTADGATAEAAHEGTSVYARTAEAARYDFAERSGKLDAQREVGPQGTRSAARIAVQRRQSDNFGFAEGAAAAGASVREAARLDSFIRTLSQTAGNQVDMVDGGAAGIADRAGNARTSQIVEAERLTRMQGLLRAHGVAMSKKELAMAQNGDLSMNLDAGTARQLHDAGLINDSQWGAIAQGGHARFSFAENDLLVSSSTGFEKSARSNTSTRFEAGKQAGPDTIEHFLSGGAEGEQQMANWLKGGFEMDRQGQWRLKPQVADTLTRDLSAIMAQTGWQRSINREAQDQNRMGTEWSVRVEGSAESVGSSGRGKAAKSSAVSRGLSGGSIGLNSSDLGVTSETVAANLDVINYDVRRAIGTAHEEAASAARPEQVFATALSVNLVGIDGLRTRYIDQAEAARGTTDLTAPITSYEQSSLLGSGRFSNDIKGSPSDRSGDR